VRVVHTPELPVPLEGPAMSGWISYPEAFGEQLLQLHKGASGVAPG
jgi:hypothetical protein